MGRLLCISERQMSVLALLTRSLGQRRPEAARYVHHTPEGASSRSYLPSEKYAHGLNGCQSETRLPAQRVDVLHTTRKFTCFLARELHADPLCGARLFRQAEARAPFDYRP